MIDHLDHIVQTCVEPEATTFIIYKYNGKQLAVYLGKQQGH